VGIQHHRKHELLKEALRFLKCEDLEMWCIGGAVRSVLTGEEQRDIDLFFGSESVYNEFSRRVSLREDIEIKHYRTGFREGAPSFFCFWRKPNGPQYDICNWTYGPLVHHIDANEWLHTSVACDMCGNLLVRADVLAAVQSRRLVPCNSEWFPELQIERMYKFMGDGWSISPEDAALVFKKLKLNVELKS
jgi:hypothetical protein